MNKESEGSNRHISALLGLLLRSDRLAEARIEVALKDTRITGAKMAALYELIHAEEPLPLGLLAQQLHCVRSNATQLVDRLVADGLVERVPDPADRRSVLARITDKGRRSYLEGMEAMQSVEHELLEHFTSPEREQFREFLTRLQKLWT